MREYYLIPADCLEALRKMRPDSIDSMVTDPPAGISFMGKEWDTEHAFKINMLRIFSEALRVLKPGAHALVWAIPRTSHWTATALEDAGFEIRDVITHLFGSGFPKSLDISKAIDKAAGAERKVIGSKLGQPGYSIAPSKKRTNSYSAGAALSDSETECTITAPSTREAENWQGYGTVLKPASEHWILVRKPLSEKTVAANVLEHGTGGINIDGCRVASEDQEKLSKNWDRVQSDKNKSGTIAREGGDLKPIDLRDRAPSGRFPANLVLSHDEDCFLPIDLDGEELLNEDSTNCTPTCAVKMLDEQSGMLHPAGNKKPSGTKGSSIFGIGLHEHQRSIDSKGGGASRFFYCAKASKSERNLGCEGLEEKEEGIGDPRPSGQSMQRLDGRDPRAMTNHHPTVKPLKLMRYLCRLVTPARGVILDPFMGSGSTGVAALQEGFSFIGIERESEYFKIALTRLRHEVFGGNK